MEIANYVGLFVYFAFAAGIGLALVVVSHLCDVRVKTAQGRSRNWGRPYECGVRTTGVQLSRFPVHYYLVGIMFVIFDVETVFMVPWAVVGNLFKSISNHVFWFVEMLVFLMILIVGYVYLLQQRVFDWGTEEEV